MSATLLKPLEILVRPLHSRKPGEQETQGAAAGGAAGQAAPAGQVPAPAPTQPAQQVRMSLRQAFKRDIKFGS